MRAKHADTAGVRKRILHSIQASSKEYVMNLHMDSAALALKAGQFLTLENACGTEIRIQDGSAWVTEEGDPNDFTLAPGEAHTVMHQGRTVVQAMNPAHLTLREGESPCAANDSSLAGTFLHAPPGTPWYASGLHALSAFVAGIGEDDERSAAYAYQSKTHQAGERLERERLGAQIGYMLSEPRYFAPE
jgi:hypothetical protein